MVKATSFALAIAGEVQNAAIFSACPGIEEE